MPTLGEKVAELKARGEPIESIRKGMEDAYGLSAKALGAYWDTDLADLNRARKEVQSYLPKASKSVLSGKPPIQPTLEQQLGPGGKDVPPSTVDQPHPLTGEVTPAQAIPVPSNPLTEENPGHIRPKRATPKLEGGLLTHPIEELKHTGNALYGFGKELLTGRTMEDYPQDGKSSVMHGQGGEEPEPKLFDTVKHAGEMLAGKGRKSATTEAYKTSLEDLEERGRHHPIVNALSDAGDFVMAPMQLAGQVLLPKEVDEQNTLSSQGRAFGENLAGGLTGGLSAQLENPGKMIWGRPVTSAAMLAPFAKAALKGAPALARVAGEIHPTLETKLMAPVGETAIGRSTSNVLSKATLSALDQMRKVGPEVHGKNAGAHFADFLSNLPKESNRWINNAVEMGDPALTAIVEQIIKDPGQAASELKSLGERMARQAEKTGTASPVEPLGMADAEASLRSKWEREIRDGYKNPNSKAADAKVQRLLDKAAQEGTQPWLEGGPIRDVHGVYDGAKGAVEVAKRSLPEDIVYENARKASQENFAKANPTIAALALRIAAKLEAPVEVVQDALMAPLDHQSLAAIHDPTVLKAVLKRIHEADPTRTPEVVKGIIKPYLDVPLTEEVHLPEIAKAGNLMGLPEIIREESMKMSQTARANVIRTVTQKLADKLQGEGTARGLLKESRRFGHEDLFKIQTPEEQAAFDAYQERFRENIAKNLTGGTAEDVTLKPTPLSFKWAAQVIRAVSKGEPVPLVLPKGITREQAKLAFKALASPGSEYFFRDTMGMDYAKVPGIALYLSDKFDNFRNPQAHVPGHQAGEVHPDLHQTLKYEDLARKGIQGSDALGMINQLSKGNLTTRSPHAAINNFTSNAAMQSSRRGNPLVWSSALNMARKFQQFLSGVEETGGAFNPMKLTLEEGRFFRAIEKTGALDTDAIAQDVGLMKVGSNLNPLRLSEKVYRHLGDNAFKLEEAHHNWNTLDGYLETLGEGESITGDLSPSRKVTFTKERGNTLVSGPGISETPIQLSPEQLDAIKARVAVQPAQNMFFDYGDTGLFAKWLKQAPILGIASPFFTWSYKALDVPFVKKGLVSHVMDLPFSIETNSPAVALNQLGQAVGLVARRAAYTSAARNDLLQNENGQLGTVLRREPRQLRMYWATMLGDPRYMGGYDYGKFNWMQPSQKLFQLLAGAGVELTKPDLKSLPKDQAKRAIRTNELLKMADTGQLYSKNDVLDLVGMAGSPILDVINYFQGKTEHKKKVSLEQSMQKFSGALLSGVGKDIFNVATGAFQDKTGIHIFGSPRHNAVDPTLQEPFVRYVVRQMTGMGFNIKNVVDTTNPAKPYSYYRELQDEWLDTLQVSDMKSKAKADLAEAKRNGDLELQVAARNRLRTANMLEHAVKGEIRSMYGHWAKGARALGLKPPPWEAPEETDEMPSYNKSKEQVDKELEDLNKQALDEIEQEHSLDEPKP